MDQATIARIRDSFALLAPSAEQLINTFYAQLFTVAPGVRPLFPSDMAQQKKHLTAAIGLVVKHVDRLDVLEKPLMEMGARHVKYGAKPEHYPVVRDTLLSSMASLAGPAWNQQLHDDWTAALNAVATVMLKGAEQAAPAAHRKAA